MKKKKIKPDDIALNLRVSKAMKSKIMMAAEQENVTMSKYLRSLLEEVFNESEKDEPTKSMRTEKFIFSMDFFKLMLWIFSKKGNERRDESEAQLDYFAKVIKKADSHLPEEVNRELDKVLADVLGMKTAMGYEKKKFNFIDSYKKEEQVNFKILEDFFLTEKFHKFLDSQRGYILLD